MDKFKTQSCIDKLRFYKGKEEECLKQVYEWVKSSHITLKIYQTLIKHITKYDKLKKLVK